VAPGSDELERRGSDRESVVVVNVNISFFVKAVKFRTNPCLGRFCSFSPNRVPSSNNSSEAFSFSTFLLRDAVVFFVHFWTHLINFFAPFSKWMSDSVNIKTQFECIQFRKNWNSWL
jgi:hypothetical protein